MKQSSQPRKSIVVAIVDDDDAMRAALESLLKCDGYPVRTFTCALDLLQTNDLSEVRFIVSDIQMPGMSGIAMLENLIAQGWRIPVIFISAFPGGAIHIPANLPGLVACLAKPFDADHLLACIDNTLNAHQ